MGGQGNKGADTLRSRMNAEPIEPDFSLGPLSIWAKGRPYADADNGWDQAFVEVYARVSLPNAWVEVGSGNGLVSMVLARFVRDLERLDGTLSGKAELQVDWINLTLIGDGIGHSAVELEIYPGHVEQQHRFRFQVDQTQVRSARQQAKALLAKYPVPAKYASDPMP